MTRPGRSAPCPDPALFVAEVARGVGFRRRALPEARLEAVLVAHDEAAREGGRRLAKQGPKSRVTRHGDLVVKERLPGGPVSRAKDRLAPGRHQAGILNALRLEREGVATARAQAWLRRDGRVFSVYDDLSALPRLDHEARRRYAHGPRVEQVRLRNAVAAWLRDLHARGVYHGDLKGVNVLVGGPAERPGLHLIDTDRVLFFGRPLRRRRRMKNLAQLGASIPTWVGRTERLRWYRAYCDEAPWVPDLRRDARDLARRLARRLVVGDLPLE